MQKYKKIWINLIVVLIATMCSITFFSSSFIVLADEIPDDITYDVWDGTSEEFSLLNSQNENSEDNPYIINTAKKLAYLAEQVNGGESFEGKYFKLTAHINLNGIVNDEYDLYGGHFWNSIGFKSETEQFAFSGHFDGGDKQIINLVFSSNETYTKSYGLFGCTNGATITNTNVSINIKLNGKNVAGLIGYAINTNVSNCDINTKISGNINNVASAIGYLETSADTTIDNVYANTLIENEGTSNTAGFIGAISNSQNSLVVSNLRVFAQINTNSNVGGIANVILSTGNTTVINCVFDGSIDANSANNVAGILGLNEGALVEGCKNYADITSTGENVAGIVAVNSGKLYNCKNYDSIIGGNYTAGIVAKTTNEVNNCINYSTVTGKEYTAGVCASATKDTNDYVFKCNYNTNIITGTNYVAGVVAYLNLVDLKYCFNNVKETNSEGYSIVGTDYVAGVIASVNQSDITTIYNISNIYSTGISSGLIANYVGNNTKNTLQEFLSIGKVKGSSVTGVVNTASSVKLLLGYTLPTLEFVENDNFNVSGAISGNFANCNFENVYYATDFCEVAHGITSDDNDEIIATTSTEIKNGQLKSLITPNYQKMAFYYLPESEVDEALHYYAYYPVLRNLFFDVYTESSENYFEDSTSVQNIYDDTIICDTYTAIVVKFVTNCATKIEDVLLRRSDNLTEVFANLPELKKEGYVFEGWFTDAKFKNEFNLEDDVTKNITLYAKFDIPFVNLPWWVFVTIGVLIVAVLSFTFFATNRKRTITFVIEGENIDPLKIKVGANLTLPNPTKNGFNFSGWYYNESFTKTFALNIMPNINLVLYGKFIKEEEKIKSETKKQSTKKLNSKDSAKTKNIKKINKQKN